MCDIVIKQGDDEVKTIRRMRNNDGGKQGMRMPAGITRYAIDGDGMFFYLTISETDKISSIRAGTCIVSSGRAARICAGNLGRENIFVVRQADKVIIIFICHLKALA